VTFRGRCASVVVPACSRHPRFYVENEGLPVGCALDSLAKHFWVLGRLCIETFVKSTCLEWLCQTPCSHTGYLDVSTLHTFKINIALSVSSLTASSYDTPFRILLGILGYWILLIKASSRLARLEGLLEVGPARLLAAML
jgi:hypothetical protein